ncbi:MAG: hypothetical protein IH846_17480, partial [Acidobacteria bacterium]|nr:hypothetical protein [Acidobacteriota bacterium]
MSKRVILFVLLAGIGTLTGFVLSGGGTGDTGSILGRRPTGHPQLISVEPLPPMNGEMNGEMCEWVPASASSSSFASYRLLQRSAQGSGADDVSKRDPVRVIRDPYAAYSAIAVDAARGEVVITDENLFNILVYDRLDNTPPNASMTEPKRIIGGLKTKIEFQCGLYIDPGSGDIYAVNNDTVDRLVIFSREAKGDVAPDRELHTPHGTFGITVDEEHQEMFLTIQHSNAIVVYHKMAVDEESPKRLLQGNNTGLADPHGIALDTKTGLLFVTNHGSVTRYPEDPGSVRDRGGEGKQNWPMGRGQALPGSGRNLPPS